jgi:hypothetical protein
LVPKGRIWVEIDGRDEKVKLVVDVDDSFDGGRAIG